jgi:hypothetical protein
MSMDKLFDGSDAHLLPAGIAECAAYLRNYNEWRRGDAEDNRESEMPHPRELGMNIDFAVAVLDALSSHDHLMIIAATRYCLGRMTYIVGDCADWLIKTWPLLSEQTKAIIQRDIEEAFKQDDKAREEGSGYRPLGDHCDRQQWDRVRSLWKGAPACQ